MLVAGQDFDFFNPYAEVKMKRANLPHWQQERVLYFVTFRLADSIPSEKLRDWSIQYENWLKSNPKPWDEEQSAEYESEFARRIERWLDAGHGACSLRNDTCHDIVSDCLTFGDPERYRLDAWVVASNHVHALVVPSKKDSLPAILKNWKGISARLINQRLGRSGSFWQKEYYDHIVRNQVALDRIRKYIAKHNP